MKNIIKIIAVSALLLSISTANSFAATMYAPDGRTIDVPYEETEIWQNVGWYSQPVITMYAPDGRNVIVYSNEISAWQAVGWYTMPVTTLYAPDGRTVVVYEFEVPAWENVGWYTYSITSVKNDMMTKYKNLITKSEYTKYALYDIDKDNYYELILSNGDFGFAQCKIYTYKNNRVSLVDSDAIQYGIYGYDGNGIFFVIGGTGNTFYVRKCLVGDVMQDDKVPYLGCISPFEDDIKYSHKGERISELQYDSIIENLFPIQFLDKDCLTPFN